MRIRIGPLPDDAAFRPEEGGWHKVKKPPFGLFLLLCLPVAAVLAAGLLSAWAALAALHGIDQSVQGTLTLRTMLLSLAALAALAWIHELVHAVALPGCGLTSATTVGFWPQAFTPYVSYKGELSRNRHLVVGLMPFLLLSVLPLLVGLLFAWMPLWVVLLTTINALASSGDIVGTILLLLQTPRSAVVRNKGLETWWRHPASATG